MQNIVLLCQPLCSHTRLEADDLLNKPSTKSNNCSGIAWLDNSFQALHILQNTSKANRNIIPVMMIRSMSIHYLHVTRGKQTIVAGIEWGLQISMAYTTVYSNANTNSTHSENHMHWGVSNPFSNMPANNHAVKYTHCSVFQVSSLHGSLQQDLLSKFSIDGYTKNWEVI